MRTSTVLSAAFAGCALSSPLIKRDPVLEIDTVYDVVYTTAYVIETAGASPAAETSSAASATPNFYHKAQKEWFSWGWHTSVVASVSEVVPSATPSTTSVAVVTSAAPVSTSSVVPVAESTSSVYVAPSSSSLSEYAASTSSAAETSTAAGAKATTYQQRVLVHHNVHRANHSAADLTWSADLASTAQTIAEKCVYAHDVTTNGGGYGQNIAAGVAPANISAVISDLFYNGEVNYFNGLYGQANPDMSNFESWGHFSQIVWKGTTQVGCATVDCSSTGLANTGSYVSPYFTVCNYKSPGNYGGEYAANIGNFLNRATADWSYGL